MHQLHPLSLFNRRFNPSWVALLYALIASIWVAATDVLLVFQVSDTSARNALDLAKDLLFVLITSGVLYGLLRIWNQARVQRLTRLYAVLSQCNQTIVRSASMQELLPQICENAVQIGGMKMAWIGLAEEGAQQILPVAASGEGIEYLDGIVISTRVDDLHGRGPVGTAVRENRVVWCQDFLRDPSAAPWHERARRYGWGSIAALPLHRHGVIIGAFCLYAGVSNAFDQAERTLLEEMAQNISYALDNFERDDARTKAEQQVSNVLAMTQHFLDNLPGTAYIKDSDLRVLMASRGHKEMLGLDPLAMIGKTNLELFPKDVGEKINSEDEQVLQTGKTTLFHEEFNGRHFESIKFVIQGDGEAPLLGGITLDITQRHLLMARQQALLEINELGLSLPETEFLQRGMAMAERLTGSTLSFLHFVSDDQAQVERAVGSTGVMSATKNASEEAEPWAECLREKKAAVYNDSKLAQQASQGQFGQVPVSRLLVAPVIEGDEVRVIAGVGNKASDYEDADIVTLLLVAGDLWHIAHRRRVETALQLQLAELTELNNKLEDSNNQLLQSEKMAAIGQLAAGVAHEINNPVSFVQSNFGSLTEYVNDLLAIDQAYAEAEQQVSGLQPQAFERVHRIKEKAGHDFIVRDVRQLIGESREGLERVSRIVRDLRDFSRVGETGWQWVDLHHGLDSTINIVRSVVNSKAEIERRYGSLPQVHCIPAQINQVFLNLLVNAAQSIDGNGLIEIRSGHDGKQVWIEVQDNGSGIQPENMKHLFEPFFTTKPLGKGTGLGLSLSWGIVQRHKGAIDVKSDPGKLTVFRVTLPVDPQREAA